MSMRPLARHLMQRACLLGPMEEANKGFDEEEDEGDSDVHFKWKRKEFSSCGPPMRKRVVTKVPQSSLAKPDAAHEASLAGEKGLTPFVSPSDPWSSGHMFWRRPKGKLSRLREDCLHLL